MPNPLLKIINWKVTRDMKNLQKKERKKSKEQNRRARYEKNLANQRKKAGVRFLKF